MKKALEEYNSDVTTAHHGGLDGRPFWNPHSLKFMYNPAFLFPKYRDVKKYRITATDCNGREHSFVSEDPTCLLTPIWKDIAPGFVTLRVDALDRDGETFLFPIAMRRFCKSDPFPGKDAYPPADRSYSEAARLGLKYIFEHSMSRSLLERGTPDPEYDLSVYPSKMLGAIIWAMLSYAELEPTASDEAIMIAKKAADYLISISYGGDSPLRGLPPTYHTGHIPDGVAKISAARDRNGKLMMIYPPDVGVYYLMLEERTGDKKYLDAARAIADWLIDHMLPVGSWYIFVDDETGEPVVDNVAIPIPAIDFFAMMYGRTGEEKYKEVENACFEHIKRYRLSTYNWEAQFEDSPFSNNYSNLSHVPINDFLYYLARNRRDDPETAEIAADLARFIEDQFVVWGKHTYINHKNAEEWYYPAGNEQYAWLRPIDASTACIIHGFLATYELTGNELWLEKAEALGNMLTRMQNSENGVIPTHWTEKDCSKVLNNFWINCHTVSSIRLFELYRKLKEYAKNNE